MTLFIIQWLWKVYCFIICLVHFVPSSDNIWPLTCCCWHAAWQHVNSNNKVKLKKHTDSGESAGKANHPSQNKKEVTPKRGAWVLFCLGVVSIEKLQHRTENHSLQNPSDQLVTMLISIFQHPAFAVVVATTDVEIRKWLCSCPRKCLFVCFFLLLPVFAITNNYKPHIKLLWSNNGPIT